MADIVTPAVIGVASSLITIFLSSRLQHFFWTRQQRAQLRLAVLQEFNRLSAEFLAEHLAAVMTSTRYIPSIAWNTAMQGVEANLRSLFSANVGALYQQLQILFGPGTPQGGLGPQGQYFANDFVDRKDAVMRQLYDECGFR